MGSGEGEMGAWGRTCSLWERLDGGRALIQQEASLGGGRCSASHWLPLTCLPRPLQDGSQAAAERMLSKAIRVLVTMANTGKKKSYPDRPGAGHASPPFR